MNLIGKIFGFRAEPGAAPVMGALELLQSYGLRGYVRPGDSAFSSRVWLYDGREIGEGGAPAWLKTMASYLKGEGVRMEDVHNVASPNGYRVSINSRLYLVYPYRTYEDWDTGVVTMLQIVNGLLESAGSNDRAYLLRGDDDRGLVVFIDRGVYLRLATDRRLFHGDRPADVGTYDLPAREAVYAPMRMAMAC